MKEETKKFIQTLGALEFKFDVRDYKLKTKEKDFPESFELSPVKVKSQGSVGSCVAHAISEVNEWFHKEQQKTNKQMSTGFIYGNRRNSLNKSEGMYVREALSNMCKYGNVFKEDFKENIEVPKAIDLFEERIDNLKDKAYPNRFTSYFRLLSDNEIKECLMHYGPVVFSMNWREDLTVDKDGVMIVNEKSEKTGGHCMMIYGWNEKGWLIQNSWGTWWGKSGRAILPYDVKKSEAWGITDDITWENSDIKKSIFNVTWLRFLVKIINFIINFFK